MSFDARPRELLEEFGRLAYPKPNESPDAAEMEKEQAGIKAAIAAYGDARSRHLEHLIEILKEPAPDKLQMAEWFLAVADARDEVGSTLGNALRDVKTPTLAGLTFLTKAQMDEVKFYGALARAQDAAASRDYIAKYRKSVDEKTKALDTKWSEEMQQHGSFDSDEKSAIADVESLMKEAAEQAAAKNKDIKEKFAGAVSVVTTMADLISTLPDNVSQAGKVIGALAQWWLDYFGQLEVRIARYQGYFRQERGSLLVMFKDFRRDAEEFVKNYGYSKVLEASERARSVLVDVKSSGSATSGQQSDAETLASAAVAVIEGMRDEAKRVWDDFVGKHEKKFFGPVGPEVEKALLASDEWDSRYKRIAAFDLSGLLSNWLNDTRNYWDIDLSGLPEDRRAALKSALESSIQDLARAEEQARKAVSLDVLYERIAKDREDAKRELLS